MSIEIQYVFKQLNQIILGKQDVIKQALACILARGHLLLEDVPGVGKTTLAHALAKVLGLSYQRVQFTNDMLPADLLGMTIFNQSHAKFEFKPGPVFHQFLLADEINRASPKLQSALLEAMEEKQVSIDNKTYRLPQPFLVVATQNPSEQVGTFALPESQLDRFMMKISMDYPIEKAEKYLYMQGDRREIFNTIKAVLSTDQLLALQKDILKVKISEAVVDYVYQLVAKTRVSGFFVQGLSPRAGLSIIAAARAWAFLENRNYLLPEDIQAIFIPVCAHRLRTLQHGHHVHAILQKLLKTTLVS